jgi:integrase
MGRVFRKCVTRPVPPTATITSQSGKRVARWRTRASKWATAEVIARPDGREMISVESGTYYAKYRDGDGIVHVIPTGCRSEDAARQALARLERDAERVKAGVVTPAELAVADAASTPIAQTIEDYLATLTGSKTHRKEFRRYLERLALDLNWHRPADLRRADLERWLADRSRLSRSARTRNAFQIAANAFANWCVRSGRISSNPFQRLPKANEDADRRRQRRALTCDELQRLVTAAQTAPERPATRPRGKDAQNTRRPQQRLSGEERAEVYAILTGTGLRVGELAQLTVADARLRDRVPHIDLPARITKDGEDETIPLRSDLVELLTLELIEDRILFSRMEARVDLGLTPSASRPCLGRDSSPCPTPGQCPGRRPPESRRDLRPPPRA